MTRALPVGVAAAHIGRRPLSTSHISVALVWSQGRVTWKHKVASTKLMDLGRVGHGMVQVRAFRNVNSTRLYACFFLKNLLVSPIGKLKPSAS